MEYQINFGITPSQISLRTKQHQWIITNSHHYGALYEAKMKLVLSYKLGVGISGNLLAIDIRQILFHFREIKNDELLWKYFCNFRIGK